MTADTETPARATVPEVPPVYAGTSAAAAWLAGYANGELAPPPAPETRRRLAGILRPGLDKIRAEAREGASAA